MVIKKEVHFVRKSVVEFIASIPKDMWTVINNEIYLRRPAGADYINSTAGTMSVWDSTKKYNFRPIKINKKVYYPVTALDAHLEQSLIEP